jgi:hypothetical protein
VTFDNKTTGHHRSKRIGREFKETKITKAKEERDIRQVSTLTVKRTLYSRLLQAHPVRL